MKTRNRSLIIATAVMCLLMGSLISGDEPVGQRQRDQNRYHIASAHDTMILLDSVTGDTWILDSHQESGKRQWLAIAREEAAGKTLPGKIEQATQKNRIAMAVEYAQEADAVIVRGNVDDIVRAVELLQESAFASKMNVNFFRDVDLGHIAVKGRKTDIPEIKRLVLTDKN